MPRRSSKKEVSGSKKPEEKKRGIPHHKNKFTKAGREKGGQDGEPKTDAQELVERFKDGGELGINAMNKVAAIFDGKEKTSQKNLSDLVSALMETLEGEDFNAGVRAADFIVRFFGSRDIDEVTKERVLQKVDKKRETPVISALVNALGDEEYNIKFYAAKALGEAVRNGMIGNDTKDSVRFALIKTSFDRNPFIGTVASDALDALKATEPPEEAIEKVKEEAAGEKVDEEKDAPEIEEAVDVSAVEEKEEAETVTEDDAVEEDVEEEDATENESEKILDTVEEEDIISGDVMEEVTGKSKQHAQHQMFLDQILMEDLKKGTPSVKIKTLQSIQKIARRREEASVFISEIAELLNDDFIDVRMEAGYTLKEIGKLAIPALIRALNNRKADARREVVWTLGNIRDNAAIPALVEVLINDGDSGVRMGAVEALSKIAVANHDMESVGIIFALMKALDDKKKDVRKNAVEALGEILERGATKQTKKVIRQALNVASEDNDPEVKRVAANVNANLGHEI